MDKKGGFIMTDTTGLERQLKEIADNINTHGKYSQNINEVLSKIGSQLTEIKTSIDTVASAIDQMANKE